MNNILDKILEEKYPEYAKLPVIHNINDENPREDFWFSLTKKEIYDVNLEFLKRTGNPKFDYITCWEPGRLNGNNESLFDYSTFYEFDLAWWEFQKEDRYKSVNEYKKWMEQGSSYWTPERVARIINDLEEEYKDGYSIYCKGDWFRMIENGKLLYAQLISAKWYIYSVLEMYIDEMREDLLPYSLNEDMDFQQILNCDDPTIKYKADGREIELASLQEAIGKYEGKSLIDLIDRMMAEFKDDYKGYTFRFDSGYELNNPDEKFDPFTDFIFWDEQALKNVRTTNFLEDFTKIQQESKLLEDLITGVKAKVHDDFMKIYNENKSRYC